MIWSLAQVCLSECILILYLPILLSNNGWHYPHNSRSLAQTSSFTLFTPSWWISKDPHDSLPYFSNNSLSHLPRILRPGCPLLVQWQLHSSKPILICRIAQVRRGQSEPVWGTEEMLLRFVRSPYVPSQDISLFQWQSWSSFVTAQDVCLIQEKAKRRRFCILKMPG